MIMISRFGLFFMLCIFQSLITAAQYGTFSKEERILFTQNNPFERFEDGRLDIVVEGRERFRVVRETEGRSFRTAEISPLRDAGDQPA